MAASMARRVLRRLRRALPRGPRPVVLMYHRIADETFDPWGLAVAPARFDEQVGWLRRHRTVLPLDEFARLHRAGKLPRNAAAITFDDGYADNRDAAAPVLDRHEAPATIFIATDPIHGEREFWWDDLQRLLIDFPADAVTLDLAGGPLEIALGKRQPDDAHWTAFVQARTPRQKGFYRAWQALRLLQPDEQEGALQALRDQAGVSAEPRPSHRTMSAAEVRDLRSARIAIGAHSLSHTSLSARSVEDQAHEIRDSRTQVAEIIGAAPKSFAYPFGDFDEHSLRLVEEAGFECACTTRSHAVGKAANAFALPRLQALNWSSDELARAIAAL
jgi:peptidoglycan/xylan/chitin deacetylase (PgdA/CDA1 family)